MLIIASVLVFSLNHSLVSAMAEFIGDSGTFVTSIIVAPTMAGRIMSERSDAVLMDATLRLLMSCARPCAIFLSIHPASIVAGGVTKRVKRSILSAGMDKVTSQKNRKSSSGVVFLFMMRVSIQAAAVSKSRPNSGSPIALISSANVGRVSSLTVSCSPDCVNCNFASVFSTYPFL